MRVIRFELKKHLKKIYKTIIVYFFLILYDKPKLINKNIEDLKFLKINYINRFNLKKYKYKLFIINNGRVFTNFVENVSIIKGNHLLEKISFQQIKGELKNKKNDTLYNGTPKFIKKIQGTVAVLTQGASGHFNYAHWLMDILPRIKFYETVYKKKIDYFYFSKLNEFQKQSLKIIDINPQKFIDSNKFRHIKANKLLVSTHPNYFKKNIFFAHSRIPKWIILFIRKTFINKINNNSYKKIFIDRSDSNQRHCKFINNNDAKNYFKSKGFKIIRLSEYSFINQISIFYNAKIIISPHGAGLANLIFAKKNCKIVEIIPNNNTNKVYRRISKINNLKYKSIYLKKIKNDKGDMMFNFKNFISHI